MRHVIARIMEYFTRKSLIHALECRPHRGYLLNERLFRVEFPLLGIQRAECHDINFRWNTHSLPMRRR